jgi:hypothetical protein
MSLFRETRLPEAEVYELLSNPRRRELLRRLPVDEWVGLHELSAQVAAAETGTTETEVPRAVRETVYVSLYQTHVPRLCDLGVMEFDAEARRVRLLDRRGVGLYMDRVTRHGVTWGEVFRWTGTVGLTGVVASLADVPVASAVDPLLWASAALGVIATASVAQLVRSLRR